MKECTAEREWLAQDVLTSRTTVSSDRKAVMQASMRPKSAVYVFYPILL